MMYNAVTIKSDLINIVTEVLMKISSEARFTTFEAISMIVGNSIGTGIIAVPYLATKNSMLDVVWMVVIAYCINVILHLIIAELSYNNGGVQLVKSFEGELFHGKMKKIFSWIIFAVYGIAIMIGISGNINGGAQIFVNWFDIPFEAAQIIYYVIAGIVVFIANKIHGIVAASQLTLLPMPVCSCTTSLNASVLDQKVVRSANNENIPARIIAQLPILSPSCIYASSLSSVPFVPISTDMVTTSTNKDDNANPIKIDLRIFFASPSSPFTTCITA